MLRDFENHPALVVLERFRHYAQKLWARGILCRNYRGDLIWERGHVASCYGMLSWRENLLRAHSNLSFSNWSYRFSNARRLKSKQQLNQKLNQTRNQNQGRWKTFLHARTATTGAKVQDLTLRYRRGLIHICVGERIDTADGWNGRGRKTEHLKVEIPGLSIRGEARTHILLRRVTPRNKDKQVLSTVC